MSFWIRLASGVCAVWLAIAMSGCVPSEQGPLSEEKEPHFVLGKSRVNAMDYQGAIEAFEQSLEANPHSAAAHYELGWLCDEKSADPAAAIYHYQQYLLLNHQADNAEVIKQRIYRCKQQLAADVLPLPSTPAAQQQLEKLSDQNRQLLDEVGKWRAYYASEQAAAKTNAPQPDDTPTPAPRQTAIQQAAIQPEQVVSPTQARPTPDRPARPKPVAVTGTPHTHVVATGETAAAISRKFGVKLSALAADNPNVNLSRIRAGQVLRIPTP
jgi:tetratricopeptide (TPR) repeat protein